VVLFFAGCSGDGADSRLQGFWQLRAMVFDGVSQDMRSSGLTWAFQGDILELRDASSVHRDIVASYRIQDGRLVVSNFFLVDREVGDVPVSDAAYLHPYGIASSVQESFEISECTSGVLVLDSPTAHLEFRRY